MKDVTQTPEDSQLKDKKRFIKINEWARKYIP